jgi:hypothetical protein
MGLGHILALAFASGWGRWSHPCLSACWNQPARTAVSDSSRAATIRAVTDGGICAIEEGPGYPEPSLAGWVIKYSLVHSQGG